MVDPGDPWPTDRLHWDYNPLGWLKAKAVDDDCENLWRIHNNLYDLSQWINKHPGECKIFTSGGCLLSFKIFVTDIACRWAGLDLADQGNGHNRSLRDVSRFWSLAKVAPEVLRERGDWSKESQVTNWGLFVVFSLTAEFLLGIFWFLQWRLWRLDSS